MDITLDKVVAMYIKLRDQKTEVEKRHTEELHPITQGMKMLEAYMQLALDQQNQKSASFSGIGTCYKQKWTKAKVVDWPAVLKWMKENERDDLLPQAVNKTVVIDEMTQTDPKTGEVTMVPCPIPGIEVESGYKINVRRS